MIKYSKEFKQEAVKIGLNSDHPYSKTDQELGVHPKTFYNWINAHISSTQSQNRRHGNYKATQRTQTHPTGSV